MSYLLVGKPQSLLNDRLHIQRRLLHCVKDSNIAAVSFKVPKSIRKKMDSMDIRWNEVLRKVIEAKIKEHEQKYAVTDFLEFRTKSKVPKNETPYTSEVLVRKTREDG